jgi:SAM-dependent methyltransferase
LATVYTGASDRWHDDYELGRPGWPAEVFELLQLPPDGAVLELGAGTGKLTRMLVSRFERVLAVEPDDGMRQLLGALCPEAQLLTGRAEEIPLPDDSVDAVFSSEAFHLFAWEDAVAEIARVLRPRGSLVLMWNLPAGPTEPSVEAAEQLLLERAPSGLDYDPVDLNTRRYADGEWRRAFAKSPFEELRELRLPNPQTVDSDALVAFLASMGWFADLPDSERRALLDEVRSLLPASEYRRRWETQVHWTRRAGPKRDRHSDAARPPTGPSH